MVMEGRGDSTRTAAGGNDDRALQQYIRSGDAEAVHALVRARMEESAFNAVRRLLQILAEELPSCAPEVHESVAERVLQLFRQAQVPYEEQIAALLSNLAVLYESEGRWEKAAEKYTLIPVENTVRTLMDDEKLQLYVRMARMFLRVGDVKTAETHMNRASRLVKADVGTSSGDERLSDTERAFKECHAAMHEAKHRFLEAATQFFGLSVEPGARAEEQMRWLEQAVLCVLVAPAGPQRHAMLTKLVRDERTPELASYPMLRCIFHGRLLRGHNMEAVAKQLRPHHRLPDGRTVLEVSVMEHNLLATGALYRNISFQDLSEILGVSPAQAEAVAAQMLYEGRLEGSIDQVDSFLEYQTSTPEAISRGDEHFENICNTLDACCQTILAKTSHFLPTLPART